MFSYISDSDMSEDPVNSLIEIAKSHKDFAVKKSLGEVPPTILIEKNNRIAAVAMSPSMDKSSTFIAIGMAKEGFDPDYINIIFDAHMREKVDNKSMEESMKEAIENNSFTSSSDCLLCLRIDKEGGIKIVVLPYSIKDDTIDWKDIENMQETKILGGYLSEKIQEIMKKKSYLKDNPHLEAYSRTLDLSSDRSKFHMGRAILAILSSKEYLIADFHSMTHPDWVDDSRPIAKMGLNTLIQSGVLPEEARESCEEVIDEYLHSHDFKYKMIELLQNNYFWLPPEIRDELDNFVMAWQCQSLMPRISPEYAVKNRQEAKWASFRKK